MNREEMINEQKKFYEILERTIAKNKKEAFHTRGNSVFGLHENLPFLGIMFGLIGAGIGVPLYLYTTFPTDFFIFYCMTVVLAPFSVVATIPNLLSKLFAKGTGKLANGYAKLDMFFNLASLKWNYKKFCKEVINSTNPSNQSILKFNEITKNFANNFYRQENEQIKKAIAQIHDKYLQKLDKKLAKAKTDEKAKAILEKIIYKYDKEASVWISLYNQFGVIAKNIYKESEKLNGKIYMPSESSFHIDDNFSQEAKEHFEKSKPAVCLGSMSGSSENKTNLTKKKNGSENTDDKKDDLTNCF